MRPNHFIALPVPGDFVRERVPAPPAQVRVFHPEDVHLTIAFLGPCSEEQARAAWAALVWPSPAMDATLGEVLPMGSPRRFTALSALLVSGREEIERAMAEARVAPCAAAGVAVDLRPPKAHVTIARPSRRASATERREALEWARSIRLEGVHVRLDRVALYGWDAERKERLFQILGQRALAP